MLREFVKGLNAVARVRRSARPRIRQRRERASRSPRMRPTAIGRPRWSTSSLVAAPGRCAPHERPRPGERVADVGARSGDVSPVRRAAVRRATLGCSTSRSSARPAARACARSAHRATSSRRADRRSSRRDAPRWRRRDAADRSTGNAHAHACDGDGADAQARCGAYARRGGRRRIRCSVPIRAQAGALAGARPGRRGAPCGSTPHRHRAGRCAHRAACTASLPMPRTRC